MYRVCLCTFIQQHASSHCSYRYASHVVNHKYFDQTKKCIVSGKHRALLILGSCSLISGFYALEFRTGIWVSVKRNSVSNYSLPITQQKNKQPVQGC